MSDLKIFSAYLVNGMIYIIIFIFFLIIYNILRSSKCDYWEKKGVPNIKPVIIFGNYIEYAFMRKNVGAVDEKICKKFPEAPLVGTYKGSAPALIVKCPDLIKLITTTDFNYFNGRELSQYISKEIFLKNVFSEVGERWRVLRQNLNPLFSSHKLKKMFQIIQTRNETLEKMLEQDIRFNKKSNVKKLMEKYTMDCVGSCAFGVDTNVMNNDSNSNLYRKIADNVTDTSYIRALCFVARDLWPAVFYGIGFKVLPNFIARFFRDLLKQAFEQRNYEPSSRNDFVDLILTLKEKSRIFGDCICNGERRTVSIEVDDDLLIAQCFAIFAAGFATSANTLCLTLFELAKNDEAQNRAHKEVDRYVNEHGGHLEYEHIMELPYLEACFNETLRLYPALGVITREVMEDYTFPSGLVVEKNTAIHIPVFYLHKNPEYFPKPELYRPERFSLEEKVNIRPFTYLPFGEGPRKCIGLRFSKIMVLSCLVTVLKKYRVVLAEGMPRTVELEPKFPATVPKNDVYLNFILRDNKI